MLDVLMKKNFYLKTFFRISYSLVIRSKNNLKIEFSKVDFLLEVISNRKKVMLLYIPT